MLETRIAELIKNANFIAICSSDSRNFDNISACAALSLFLDANGKKSTIIIPTPLSEKYKKFLDEYNVQVQTQIDPVKYVIRIDYGKVPIEKVSYDTDEIAGKINFYITPKKKEFDFDNVEYGKDGYDYDLLILIGVKRFEELGEVYETNKALFKKNKMISVAREVEYLSDNQILVDGNVAISEEILNILEACDGDITKDEAELLLNGVVDEYGILEGSGTDKSSTIITRLIEKGGNLSKSIKTVYFSKDVSNMIIQIKLMQNLKVDEKNSIIWSGVSYDDIQKEKITKEVLDLKGRTIFNISGEYDLAVAVYEIEKGSLEITVESNKISRYSAIKIASYFDGQGTESFARCSMKNVQLKDFENAFYSVLSRVYWGTKVQNTNSPQNTLKQ